MANSLGGTRSQNYEGSVLPGEVPQKDVTS